MKRMSDVFDLPVSTLDIGYYIHTIYESEEYAARAINHVDALADAIQVILDDYILWCGDDPDLTTDRCHELHQKMMNAKSTLKAYRGGK